MQIFIIEDDIFWSDSIAKFFRSLGHIAEFASNIEDVDLTLDGGFKPDLLICDWDLKGLPADSVLTLLFRSYPQLRDCSLILMSANKAASSEFAPSVIKKKYPICEMNWFSAIQSLSKINNY